MHELNCKLDEMAMAACSAGRSVDNLCNDVLLSRYGQTLGMAALNSKALPCVSQFGGANINATFAEAAWKDPSLPPV